jgi:hypothetical protein
MTQPHVVYFFKVASTGVFEFYVVNIQRNTRKGSSTFSFLGYDIMESGRRMPTFHMNTLSSFLGSRYESTRCHNPEKRQIHIKTTYTWPCSFNYISVEIQVYVFVQFNIVAVVLNRSANKKNEIKARVLSENSSATLFTLVY